MAAGPMSGGGNSRVCRWWRWRRERRLLAPQGQTPLCTSWARLQLRRRLPCLVWLPRYSRTLFFIDVSTGITVGVVLIPQVRANATAAWHGMRTPSPSGAEAGVVCCSPSVGPDHPAQCAGDAIPRRVRKCTRTDRLRLAVGVPAVRVTPVPHVLLGRPSRTRCWRSCPPHTASTLHCCRWPSSRRSPPLATWRSAPLRSSRCWWLTRFLKSSTPRAQTNTARRQCCSQPWSGWCTCSWPQSEQARNSQCCHSRGCSTQSRASAAAASAAGATAAP